MGQAKLLILEAGFLPMHDSASGKLLFPLQDLCVPVKLNWLPLVHRSCHFLFTLRMRSLGWEGSYHFFHDQDSTTYQLWHFEIVAFLSGEDCSGKSEIMCVIHLAHCFVCSGVPQVLSPVPFWWGFPIRRNILPVNIRNVQTCEELRL